MTWTCSVCQQTFSHAVPFEHVCCTTVALTDDQLTRELYALLRQLDLVLEQNEKLLCALLQTPQE